MKTHRKGSQGVMKIDILKLALICVDILITLIAIIGLIWFFFIKN